MDHAPRLLREWPVTSADVVILEPHSRILHETMSPPMRIAIVGPTNLGPYHLARYNGLATLDIDLHIVTSPIREHKRPWHFATDEAHFSLHAPFSPGHASLSPRTLAEAQRWLEEMQPQAVVVIGYASPYGWAFALAARRKKIPTLLTLIGCKPRTHSSRELVKRALCTALFDAALVPGARGAEYALSLGIRASHIHRVGNVVDNRHFGMDAGTRNTSARSFLYVGRLSPEKNLDSLLAGYAAYRQQGGDWRLRIVGDGPEAGRLRERLRSIPDSDLAGWVGYDELPGVLQSSTALVLPSRYEPWGLVVNEAMAAGLPVLVSKSCGCWPELCLDGNNGFTIDPERPTSITQAMRRLSELSPQTLAEMGNASSQIIGAFDLSTWCRRFRRALLMELRGP